MKSLRGYVSSRSFMGERVAQHVQNTILRDYCIKKEARYLLSGTEYAMKDSYLMLNELVYEIPKTDGIVAFSLFQLSEDKNIRIGLYKEILARGGEFHFALEDISITNEEEVNRVENIWMVRQILPSCITYVKN